MKGLSWKLVLVGNTSPNHKSYYEEIRSIMTDNVHIIGHIDHEALPYYYLAAKIHILPSWMETTGLSSLEAAAMGCNIVITKKGDTEEYFGNAAFYCEPDNIESIRSTIIAAHTKAKSLEYSHYIRERFSWRRAAQDTISCYRSLLSY
jgi:glycosyltransferase involved in cell wall biosynthesis